ncbi:hypothetical protein Geu3261_0071_001 [Komagataeibacter europaeus NBRC 3261]|uniref:Uncharacterized protein n=1 Tax=Komagataeibacter europaeus NBRC 3261 TaxID=1234669 RepID=A0A0D6Q0G0_KOMEU|nr:hypothetical protein Geu3261_0071_001 [Komagataeibacter europaeus NBRC 3261]
MGQPECVGALDILLHLPVDLPRCMRALFAFRRAGLAQHQLAQFLVQDTETALMDIAGAGRGFRLRKLDAEISQKGCTSG